MRSNAKDPRGGLTAAGRAEYAREEGAHLRPGVRGRADTPEKMRRKGSFLRRMFGHDGGPLVDEDGEPTRRALSAHAWGEPVPRTKKAARALAAKGARLLERYKEEKDMAAKKSATKKSASKKSGAKKSGAKKSSSKKSGAKKSSSKKSGSKKNSLVNNINRRKRAGKSRSKKRSTVSKKAYDDMKKGWPKSRKKRSSSR
jgi:hypothetical protein